MGRVAIKKMLNGLLKKYKSSFPPPRPAGIYCAPASGHTSGLVRCRACLGCPMPPRGRAAPWLARYDVGRNLIVFVPHLPSGMPDAEAASAQRRLEAQLLKRADIVFTGGMSLYEAKRRQHPNVHAFPSAVDVEHFAQARPRKTDPADQRDISHPRLGFFGVIDERLDRDLVAELAWKRPEWQLILVGP